MKISACWIAKNESANLGRSIESLKDIADELIVVDTGSTDDTVAIAESFGARVDYFEWIGDFAAARNHAMSLATGGVIIFLDADEWFEPKLNATDRAKITEIFSKNSKAEMLTITINNLDTDGTVANTTVVSRLFRNKPALRYKGSIHEFIPPTAPGTNVLVRDGLVINHSGYAGNVVGGKIQRNASLLEDALSKAAEGTDDRYRLLSYLVREYFQIGQYEKASGFLVELLRSTDGIEKLCRSHTEEIISTLYAAIWTALYRRGDVSRRDVRRKLFDIFKKMYPNYPGTAEIDVLYQALFDLKEDRFLREIEPAVNAARKKPTSVSYYKDREPFLYSRAALAAWRRGDRMKSMEYAVASLRGSKEHRQDQLLHVMLNAVKGQPPEDVVFFLNSIFDVSDPGDLDYLVRETVVDGFLTVHSYYLKKRIDLGEAYVRHHLRFLLINQKYEALAALAVDGHAAGDVDAAQYMLLAAVCGAPRELIEAHSDVLGEYGRIVKAYYDGERLMELSSADANLLQGTYATVAFAAGLDAAERYLEVFKNLPSLCFLTKAVYCEVGGLPGYLLREDLNVVGRLDFSCRRYIIQALIAAGRHGEALQGIEAFLEQDYIEPDLLHMLLVIAEKASGDAGAEARLLYARYIDMYDTLVDLDDLVNTGIVFDDGGKKQNQFFRSMSREQFNKYLAEEAPRPVTKKLLELYRKAADIYRQKGLPAEAARCLWRIIAHMSGEKEVCETLAEIFAGMNNTALPDYIRTLSA